MKMTHKEIDITTGVETITEVEETEQDKLIRLHFEAEKVAQMEKLKEIEINKSALFAKLGITADEAKLLLS
jgi:hypothetical protein